MAKSNSKLSTLFKATVSLLVMLSLGLAVMVCYAGLMTFLILPGETREAGAFTIQRGLYLDTVRGRVTPASVVIGSDVVTYTFVVSK